MPRYRIPDDQPSPWRGRKHHYTASDLQAERTTLLAAIVESRGVLMAAAASLGRTRQWAYQWVRRLNLWSALNDARLLRVAEDYATPANQHHQTLTALVPNAPQPKRRPTTPVWWKRTRSH